MRINKSLLNRAVTRQMVAERTVNRHTVTDSTFHRLQPERNNRRIVRKRLGPGDHRKFAQNIAELRGFRFRRDFLAKSDRNDTRQLFTEVDIFISIASLATPNALDVERNELCTRILDGRGIVHREASDIAGFCNFTFRENHDGFTLQKGFANLRHRGFRIATVNADRAEKFQNPAGITVFQLIFIHRHTERPRARHLQKHPVDIARMIAEQKHRTFERNVFVTDDLQIITEHIIGAEQRTDERLREPDKSPHKCGKQKKREEEKECFLVD